MIEVFNRDFQRVAILEHAFSISLDEKINTLAYLTFSMPIDDPKTEHCQPFCYVRHDGGELFRLMPSEEQQEEANSITFHCEHVLVTLMDEVLYGYHAPRSGTTSGYINYILSKQRTKNWVLKRCDFTRYFEYAWENEGLLAALFSVANPLSGYIWRTNTHVYPWELSLETLQTTGDPQLRVRTGKNLLSFGNTPDYTQICTRLYPLGYGEGINQLTIKDVNSGKPYLENPTAIAKYGLIERVWIDRRYEDKESLKAAAQNMLNELSNPIQSYEVGLEEIQGEAAVEIGQRVRVEPEFGDKIDTYIVEISRNYEEITETTITLANRSTDIAGTVADLADRVRIEQAYSQGATQLYALSLQANASTTEGATLDFYIPQEMRYVNKVLAKINLDSFRAYSETTSTEPSQHSSTSSGGGSYDTTNSGGGAYDSTDSGGGSVESSDAVTLTVRNTYAVDDGGRGSSNHNHGIDRSTRLAVVDRKNEIIGAVIWTPSGAHEHEAHSHEVRIPRHRHDFEIPDHTHRFEVRDHSHSFTVPAHKHDVAPGIFRFGNPRSFTLYINGKARQTFSSTNEELDITKYLLDTGGKIPRGAWHNVEIRPNDLSYITINVYLQGFVQSRGDQTV